MNSNGMSLLLLHLLQVFIESISLLFSGESSLPIRKHRQAPSLPSPRLFVPPHIPESLHRLLFSEHDRTLRDRSELALVSELYEVGDDAAHHPIERLRQISAHRVGSHVHEIEQIPIVGLLVVPTVSLPPLPFSFLRDSRSSINHRHDSLELLRKLPEEVDSASVSNVHLVLENDVSGEGRPGNSTCRHTTETTVYPQGRETHQ